MGNLGRKTEQATLVKFSGCRKRSATPLLSGKKRSRSADGVNRETSPAPPSLPSARSRDGTGGRRTPERDRSPRADHGPTRGDPGPWPHSRRSPPPGASSRPHSLASSSSSFAELDPRRSVPLAGQHPPQKKPELGSALSGNITTGADHTTAALSHAWGDSEPQRSRVSGSVCPSVRPPPPKTLPHQRRPRRSPICPRRTGQDGRSPWGAAAGHGHAWTAASPLYLSMGATARLPRVSGTRHYPRSAPPRSPPPLIPAAPDPPAGPGRPAPPAPPRSRGAGRDRGSAVGGGERRPPPGLEGRRGPGDPCPGARIPPTPHPGVGPLGKEQG